jgi:hypothetical protein
MTTETEWRAYCFEGEVERFDVNLMFACMGEVDRRWKAADRQPGFPPSEAWWEDVRALYIETMEARRNGMGDAQIEWQVELARTAARGQHTDLVANANTLRRTEAYRRRKEKDEEKKRRTLRRRLEKGMHVPLWYRREVDNENAPRRTPQLRLFSKKEEQDAQKEERTGGQAARQPLGENRG